MRWKEPRFGFLESTTVKNELNLVYVFQNGIAEHWRLSFDGHIAHTVDICDRLWLLPDGLKRMLSASFIASKCWRSAFCIIPLSTSRVIMSFLAARCTRRTKGSSCIIVRSNTPTHFRRERIKRMPGQCLGQMSSSYPFVRPLVTQRFAHEGF